MNNKMKTKRLTALLLSVLTVVTLALPAAAAEIKYMPDVTAEMSDASYWAKLYDDAREVILSPEEIKAFNEDTYIASGTMVMDLRTIKDTFDGKARNEAIKKSATADAEYYFGWTYGSDGKKADWSVIRVFDRFAMQKDLGGKPVLVAEQRYHTDHDLLAYDAARIAKWYDNALLVIESNTLETSDRERDIDGNMTEYILDSIADIYDNLYARKASAEQIKQGIPKRWGFHTNTATKPQIIANLVGCVRDHLWVERSDYCCTELALYQKNDKGQFSAPPGEGMHDDVLMCTAIALWICYCDMELPVIIKKKPSRKRTLDSNNASHI